MTWLGRGVRSCVPTVAMKGLGEGERQGRESKSEHTNFHRRFFFTTLHISLRDCIITKPKSEATVFIP